MPTPGEHKTVQARILKYAETIGWTVVSRKKAEQQRGFDPEVPAKDRAKGRSLFFDDTLDGHSGDRVARVLLALSARAEGSGGRLA